MCDFDGSKTIVSWYCLLVVEQQAFLFSPWRQWTLIQYIFDKSLKQETFNIIESNKSVHIDGKAETVETSIVNKIAEKLIVLRCVSTIFQALGPGQNPSSDCRTHSDSFPWFVHHRVQPLCQRFSGSGLLRKRLTPKWKVARLTYIIYY